MTDPQALPAHIAWFKPAKGRRGIALHLRNKPSFDAAYLADGWTPIEDPITTAARIAELEAALEEARKGQQPAGLIDRVKAAEQRIRDNHAPRRIPADPTDVDLVLAEVRLFLEGAEPPFWAAAPSAAAGKE